MSASTARRSRPTTSTPVHLRDGEAGRLGRGCRGAQRGCGGGRGLDGRAPHAAVGVAFDDARGNDHPAAAREGERADRPRAHGSVASRPRRNRVVIDRAEGRDGVRRLYDRGDAGGHEAPDAVEPRGAVGREVVEEVAGAGQQLGARATRRARSGARRGVGGRHDRGPRDELGGAGAERAVRHVGESGGADQSQELRTRREVRGRRGQVRVRAPVGEQPADERHDLAEPQAVHGTGGRARRFAHVEERDAAVRPEHPGALGEHAVRGRRSCAARTRT